MLQMVVTYEKKTLKVVSAIHVNTIITEANILKDSNFNVLITANSKSIYLVGQQMFLHKEFVK